MIRRLFWLLLGAVVGVAGYRRAARLARPVSRAARARGLSRFAADVRGGMEMYMERHPPRPPLTLGDQQALTRASRAGRDAAVPGRYDVKDGR